MKTKKQKTLTIEWKHLARDGRTCERCGETGAAVREAVRHLKQHCRPQGVKIELRETKLPKSRLAESNVLLFNGVPLEQLIAGAKTGKNQCGSCSDLLGTETQCRTVQHGGRTLEAIPSRLILQAACRSLDCACGKRGADACRAEVEARKA